MMKFLALYQCFHTEDEADAIRIANDSDFGLGASVYTSNEARGYRVAEQLEAGTAFVNHMSWTYASMPMGGVKKSGYGRELGTLGIKEFINEKLIRSFDAEQNAVKNPEIAKTL